MKRFEDKRVLVTGGTSGMGSAAAQRFLAEGAVVAVTGRDRDRVEAVAARFSDHGHALPVVCDVTDLDSIETALREVGERFGGLDVLFANAGTGFFSPLADVGEADFDEVVAADFKGAFFLVQKALPLLSDGAAIVINASWTLHRGGVSSTVYSATKAAVHNLARTIANELAPRGIRVNSVSPGYVNTGQFNEELVGAEGAAHRRGQVPLERFGEPSEVAAAVAFLASSDASYVNAHDLVVDGGLVGTSVLPAATRQEAR